MRLLAVNPDCDPGPMSNFLCLGSAIGIPAALVALAVGRKATNPLTYLVVILPFAAGAAFIAFILSLCATAGV